MKLKEGEKYETKILEGGGEYKEGTYDSKLIDFNVSKDGEILIKAKKTGKTYAQIIDKYNQTQNLKVKIKDTRLVVGDSNLKLKSGEKYLVPIYDHYGTIQIQKTNSNILVRYKAGDNGTDYLEITAKKSGRSIIGLRDEEGNRGSIAVEVGGGEVKSEEEKEEVKKEEVKEDLGSIEKELLKELEKLFEGLGIEINSVDENNTETIKISNAYLYSKYNKLVIKLRKTDTGKKRYTKIVNFGNKIKGLHPNKLETILEKIDLIKEKSGYKGLLKDIIDFIEVTIQIEVEDYWRKNLEELIKLQKDLIKGYADIGLDITGLKATGEGLGAVTAYWVGYINDDPYLMDQVDLQKDLVAVGSELNPLRKFKKLQKLGERIRDLKKVKFLRIGGKKIDADKFHRIIKPAILNKAGKFSWKVGKNPDISVKNGKIVLLGNGPFKNKSFETGLNFNDFIK